MILSASLGAGHDGAARELARRLQGRGYRTRVEDYLDCFPLGIGSLIRWIYGVQLRVAPWAYEATFRVWYLGRPLRRALAVVLSVLTCRRVRRLLADPALAGVVSTYPLQSMVLARGRRRGWLGAPVTTFVTDFGVHPLWVNEGVDLTICVHEASAAEARARSSGRVVATGPMVAPRFRLVGGDRAAARRVLGLPAEAAVALVVAGSWGVGDVERTFDELHATGRWLPVALCGTNEALRARLADRGYGRALGWTDGMAALLAAADVLVQNAGGLSCMEAFAVGLPVVTFHPLPGHGRENAARMASAGVATVASGPVELAEVLERATGPDREAMVAAGRALFRGDPAAEVDALIRAGRASVRHPSRPGSMRHRLPAARRSGATRRLAGAAMSITVAYVGFNLAADTATAHGLDAARPERGTQDIYVAVRLSPAIASSPTLAGVLAADHVTAVVDGSLAATRPAEVRSLARRGVDLAIGGWQDQERFHLVRPTDDLIRASRAVRLAAGVACRDYAPASGVSGVDLASALVHHVRIVEPSDLLSPSGSDPAPLRSGHVYIVRAGAAGAGQVEVVLDRLLRAATSAHLVVAPLADLG